MMFRVEWLQSALDELADVWARADSAQRGAITAASHAVEQRLQRDPWNEGESRSGGGKADHVLSPFGRHFSD